MVEDIRTGRPKGGWAYARLINEGLGIGQCVVCKEHLLEDERHVHTRQEIDEAEKKLREQSDGA